MAGRHSKHTDKLATKICEAIANGQSLVKICAEKGMPSRMSVMRWLNSGKYPEFVAQYARAREIQGDYMDDLILSTANNCTAATAKADRVKIGAYQWRAAKLRPKKYGDKFLNEHTGADGGPIAVVDASDKMKAILDAKSG